MTNMDIKLLKIKYKNIREFDDLEISFMNDDDQEHPYHISLIQMPNGTGKTTTIDLMRCAISGQKPLKIKSFASKDKSIDEGFFEIHGYIDNQYYVFRLNFDFLNEECEFYTSRPNITGGGMQKGHNLPVGIKHIVDAAFTDLFIFDGELSKRLLKPEYSAAKDAIEVIYHLDKLSALNNEIDSIVQDRQKNKMSGVTSDQGLTQQKTRLKNLKITLENLDQGKSEIETHIKEQSDKLIGLESQKNAYYEKYKDAKKMRDDILAKKNETLQSIINNVDETLDIIRMPTQYSLFFYNELNDLGNNLVKLKLPKTISTEFFNELADSERCVCGELIDEIRKQNILKNAEAYLSDDDIAEMNSVKKSIKDIQNYINLSTHMEKLSTDHRRSNELRQELNFLEISFSDTDRKMYDTIKKEITRIKYKIENCSKTLLYLTTDDKIYLEGLTEKDNIYLCNQAIDELTKRIDEATNTVNFSTQAKMLRSINDRIRNRANSDIKKQIIIESNQKIMQLLGTNEILIGDINNSLSIKDRDGVSQGQSLAIAYAYLATLFDDSSHKIPFVIDSPAGALDLEVRREVSNIIPKLYDQLVIFIISSEREGFIDGIEAYGDLQYVTVYKDRKDGHVCTNFDKDFFMNFHSEDANVISAQ